MENNYNHVIDKTINTPVVDKEICTGCGTCVKECPSLTAKMIDDKADIRMTGEVLDCVECGHCVSVCPSGAITDPLAGPDDNREFKFSDLPTSESLQVLFRSRRSVRRFKDKPVSREDLEQILNAARFAPTGGNKPLDVNYLVLSTPEAVADIRKPVLEGVTRMFNTLNKAPVRFIVGKLIGKENIKTIINYIPLLERFRVIYETTGKDMLFWNAPAAIIVHGKKRNDTIAFGCAIALHHAVLMGETMKIGSCYNGLFQEAINNDAKIKEMFGIPKEHKCYGAMTLGYTKPKYKRVVRRVPSEVTWR